MNSKRSHLDTLNAGRQRKPHTSLEELNRTLETLESRFERARAPENEPVRREEDIARRMQRLSEDAAWPAHAPHSGKAAAGAGPFHFDRPVPERSVHGLALDVKRARMQEEGLAAVAKIAGELKDLREELRHQMSAGLRREFDALRADLERAYEAASSGTYGAELAAELERLSAAIRLLADRSDEHSVSMLRQEMQEVKNALEELAREETVRSVERRWDDFDQRWDAFEERRQVCDPAIEALNARLEQIDSAISSIPESLSLHSLEEKVRTLATAIERFSRQQEHVTPEAFDAIEERLDEISRAIVASSLTAQAPSLNPEPFERIEARITSLARQLEELAGEPPAREAMEGLARLSQRVDEIAHKADVPEIAVRKLAQQIAVISHKLDNTQAAPDADRILQGLEERFGALSAMLESRQSDAFQEGQTLLRDMERRLEDLAVRLDQRNGSAAPTDTAIWDAMDARFAELAGRLQHPADGDVVRSLEARLEDISSRLDHSSKQAQGIDPDLIRNLEAQVAGLTEHLSRPGNPLPEFEDIGPRLDHIEQSIAGTRDAILKAARQATEDAIRNFSGSKSDEIAATALAEDLKSLERLARRSDERNTKTFEAIHDTLLKIVDRLGMLESSRFEQDALAGWDSQTEESPKSKVAVDTAPPTDPEYDEMLPADDEAGELRDLARSPAEAAAAAAVAALNEPAEQAVAALNEPAEQAGPRSMLGNLTRAFAPGKEQGRPVALAGNDPRSNLALAPEVEFDEPLDPNIANQPLEPGSGAPDLNAILKRVRDDRGHAATSGKADAAKADFIAAARRAAQAAAAEAEILKKNSDKSGVSGKFSLGSVLRARRKTLLVTAGVIMIALAGLQMSKAFWGGDGQHAVVEPTPAAGQQPVESSEEDERAPADEPLQESPRGDVGGEKTPGPRKIDSADDVAAPVEDDADSGIMEESAAEPAGSSGAEAFPPAAAIQDPVAAAAANEPVAIGPVALREAVAAGDAKAMFEVGSRYAEGRGTEEDLATAAKWYERSAELGFAPAQYRIGNLYEKGLGISRDIPKARIWYRKAAEQVNASAMHNMAVLYAMGVDGEADNEAAGRWFLEAAELGVKDSQFNLGVLTAKGVGMPQNLEESYKWFALVAETGDKDAAAKRDEIANTLDAEQLERARGATELWKAKPVDPEANVVEVPDAWQEMEDTTGSIDKTQAVRSIQLILNENGYDAGRADGVMGQRTRAAIAAFQKDNDMAATGEVDERLVQALLGKG
jgi:localization factor PodJL